MRKIRLFALLFALPLAACSRREVPISPEPEPPRLVETTEEAPAHTQGGPESALPELRRMLAEAREERARADTKAALLLATVGLVVSVSVGSMSAFNCPRTIAWSPATPTSTNSLVGANSRSTSSSTPRTTTRSTVRSRGHAKL